MGNYRRIPEIVSAAQWRPDGPPIPGVTTYPHGSETQPAVKTVAGWHLLRPGDWVVLFDGGDRAVFSDEYFRLTFEAC